MPAPFDDFPWSRMMLGTVQLGMAYGVGNRTGQPDEREARAIVEAAVTGGVNCFDTAAAYGTSEEVLGRALHELRIADHVAVVTKVRPLADDQLNNADVASRAIEQSVLESRRRLRLDCLPVVLFHREADAIHLPVLEELRARGWIRRFGVSCDHRPNGARRFVADRHVSVLQLPGNVLDRRHLRSGILEESETAGVGLFIRSVYLQGLIVMPEDEVPPHLRDLIPARRRLASIAASAGMTVAEIAARYLLAQPGVTSVLMGAETVAQVRENSAIFARGPLPPGIVAVIDGQAWDLPERLITPALWPPAPIREPGSHAS